MLSFSKAKGTCNSIILYRFINDKNFTRHIGNLFKFVHQNISGFFKTDLMILKGQAKAFEVINFLLLLVLL